MLRNLETVLTPAIAFMESADPRIVPGMLAIGCRRRSGVGAEDGGATTWMGGLSRWPQPACAGSTLGTATIATNDRHI